MCDFRAPMSVDARRSPAIDALRGIAVLAVLLDHLPFSGSLTPATVAGSAAVPVFPSWLSDALSVGQYGVNLFLVLSGFCIHMRWARRGDLMERVDFLPFWRRRLHRLYPPYLVALLASIAGLFVLHGVLGHAGPSLHQQLGYASSSQLAVDVLLLLILSQNLNGASHRIGNPPFWTLALEEQLYLLYFPLLGMRRRWGWRVTLGVIAAVTLGLRAAAPMMPASFGVFWFLVGPTRWLEWALGALAVEAHVGIVKLPRWCFSGILAALALVGATALRMLPGVLHLPRLPALEDPAFGFAFFLLTNAACAARWGERASGIVARPLVRVGLFSYSIYLVHMPILTAVKQVGIRLGLGVAAITILRLAVPIALAYVFFLVVERRFLNRPGRAAPGLAAEKPAKAA